jgi:hypothetical protein
MWFNTPTWMNMSIDEWFHMDECHFCMDEINKSLDEIHPWLENKWIQNYFYTSLVVVQVLIFQTWMSFNNDGSWNCDSRGKYDDGTKIIFKFCLKIMNNVNQFKKYFMEWVTPPPPPSLYPIVVNNIIYLCRKKLRCIENK